MIGRLRAAYVVALALSVAIVGCASLLGVDKDYVEVSVFDSGGGSGPSDGAPSDGQNGSDRPILPPDDGGPLPPPTSLAAGAGSSCAVLTGGAVACWGDNAAGSVGDGTTEARLRPVTTQPLGATAVGVGVGGDLATGAQSCALLSSGVVSCWGANAGADAASSLAPTPVSAPPLAGIDPNGVPMIAVGLGFACISTGGPIYCWGANDFGQLGDGSHGTSRATPAPVTGIDVTRALVAGDRHACAVTPNGALCWGSNASGQLGLYGAGQGPIPSPNKVYGGGDAIAIAAGANHSCMIHAGGRMACWGANNAGQLGNGNNLPRGLPEAVGAKTSAGELTGTAIYAGGDHTCALVADGGVDCWGQNGAGELGDGTQTDRLAPVAVNGLAITAQRLALGVEHTCAFSDSHVECWGAGGRLGDGTTAASPAPVPVAF